MTPASQSTGKAPRRTRRTGAQIEEDLIASGLPSSGARATPAAIKHSCLAAQKRAQSASMAASSRNNRDSPPFQLIKYQTIVAFLSNPRICNSIFGGGSQTRVNGMPMQPTLILNLLAIKINNSYNIRNNCTDMRLNGRVLHQRLKRYKSKYTSTKAFSSKTGSGLSAKNTADGIETMEELLESMCPCYNDMDTIFRDNPNINPFGVLDTGILPSDNSSDDSDDDTQGNLNVHRVQSNDSLSDGHDHTVAENDSSGSSAKIPSPGPEELLAHQEILEAQLPTALVSNLVLLPSPHLNAHYRAFLDNDNDHDSLPPTPTFDSAELPVPEIPAVRANATPAPAKKPARKTSKSKSKKDQLTAEERAMESSSDDATPVSTGTQARSFTRATLAGRAVDPLPSIDPSSVLGKDHKHPVATAMQNGNAAKIEMLKAAYQWRQEFDARKPKDELAARQSDLSWAKEKFFLEREEERNRMALVTRKEQQAFCEKLVLEGKTPLELKAYLCLVYPEDHQMGGNMNLVV